MRSRTREELAEWTSSPSCHVHTHELICTLTHVPMYVHACGCNCRRYIQYYCVHCMAVCVHASVCVYHTHLTPGQRRAHWMWDSALQSPSAVERVWPCLALKGKPHTCRSRKNNHTRPTYTTIDHTRTYVHTHSPGPMALQKPPVEYTRKCVLNTLTHAKQWIAMVNIYVRTYIH